MFYKVKVTKRTRLKLFALIALLLFSIMQSVGYVYADNVAYYSVDKSFIPDVYTGTSFLTTVSKYNEATGGGFVFGISSTNGTNTAVSYSADSNATVPSYLVFNTSNYVKMSGSQQQKLIQSVVKTKLYQNLDMDAKSEFINEVDSNSENSATILALMFGETSPDYGGAFKLLQPFNGPVGTGLGVFIIVLVAGIIFSTASDITYIVLPYFSKDTESRDKVKLVSRSAIKCVKDGETNNKTSWNIIFAYMKDRLGMWLLFGVCLVYLIQGRVIDFVSWILGLSGGTI